MISIITGTRPFDRASYKHYMISNIFFPIFKPSNEELTILSIAMIQVPSAVR